MLNHMSQEKFDLPWIRCPRRRMLPGGGKICEAEVPPWREAKKGHRIFCHIPLEQLKTIKPVVHPTKEAREVSEKLRRHLRASLARS
jgi:hypothetical protein